MSTKRIAQLYAVSLLVLPLTGCRTTKTSIRSDRTTGSALRSELEQKDNLHSRELAHNRRVAAGDRTEPLVTQASDPSGLSQRLFRRKEWGALPLNPAKLDVVGGRWEKLTVHHSDEVGALVFNGTLSQSSEAVRSIQRQHLQGNRWGDIGYHYIIDARGRIFEGRPLSWQGAHAGDRYKNRRNLGICLLGNFNKEAPSSLARQALGRLLDDLREVYEIPREEVYVHSEFTNTECPGHHLTNWVKSYRGGGSLSHRSP